VTVADTAYTSPLLHAKLTPVGLAQYDDHTYKLYRWIALVQRYLLEVAAGRIQNLAVYVPPQMGKSTLLSRYFPAWMIGVDPTKRIILASYAERLARSHGLAARRLIEGYGETVFDGLTVDPARAAASEWGVLDHPGGMLSVGIGSSTTGRPADIFVIDDPHAGPKEALSRTQQEDVWDWYQTVSTTRLQPNGGRILMQTRWADGDLGGRIGRRAAETGEPWTVIRLPAIAEEDEALGDDLDFPWRRAAGQVLEPRRYSLQNMLDRQANADPRWWQAVYQQSPRLNSGDVFRRDWFRYYHSERTQFGETFVLPRDGGEKRVNLQALKVFTTTDLAVSTSNRADFTVTAVWGLVKSTSDLILLDVQRGRMEGPDIVPSLIGVFGRWRPSQMFVEQVAYQLTIVQEAKSRGLPVLGWIPRGDKLARAEFAAGRLEGGRVWFPSQAPWLAAWEEELLAFDTGLHDDQVDTLSMAVDTVQVSMIDRSLRVRDA
jgi:predicted phage terminase large subunit-like protein